MRLLLDYSWPGNVRELANVIEYAVVVARGETILPEDLPLEIREPAQPGLQNAQVPTPSATCASSDPVRNEASEAEQLLAVLEKHRWKRVEAARELGISRSTLWRRMRELRLE
jgi:transcriptional regulator of acetoin/glycerol metabolism